MDLNTFQQLAQLGIAGSIIAAVVYLQRSTFNNLQQLIGLLMPALDVRADVARVEGKVDTLANVIGRQAAPWDDSGAQPIEVDDDDDDEADDDDDDDDHDDGGDAKGEAAA